LKRLALSSMEALLKGGYSGGDELRQEMENNTATQSPSKILGKVRDRNMTALLKGGYSGGEELRRAMAALAGPNHPNDPSDVSLITQALLHLSPQMPKA
jgi:hypothetical protein